MINTAPEDALRARYKPALSDTPVIEAAFTTRHRLMAAIVVAAQRVRQRIL